MGGGGTGTDQTFPGTDPRRRNHKGGRGAPGIGTEAAAPQQERRGGDQYPGPASPVPASSTPYLRLIQVPQAETSVEPRRQHRPAVGRKEAARQGGGALRHLVDAATARQRRRLERLDAPSRATAPHPAETVEARREEVKTVGAPVDGGDGVGVGWQDADGGSPNAGVPAGGGEERETGSEVGGVMETGARLRLPGGREGEHARRKPTAIGRGSRGGRGRRGWGGQRGQRGRGNGCN